MMLPEEFICLLYGAVRTYHFTCMVSIPKMFSFNLNRGMLYEKIGLDYCRKIHKKQERGLGTVLYQVRIKRHDNQKQSMVLQWILDL
jgi:hypothetical protein